MEFYAIEWIQKILDYWGNEQINRIDHLPVEQLSIEHKDYLTWVQNATYYREIDHSKASYHLQESNCFDPVINRHLIFAYLIECLQSADFDDSLLYESIPHCLKFRDEYEATFFKSDFDYLTGALQCLAYKAEHKSTKRRLKAIIRLWRMQSFEDID